MILRLAFFIVVFTSILRAEDVTVFQSIRAEGRKVSIGAQLATFTTGQKGLQTIYSEYEKTSWTVEPFYGPIVPYIFKDSAGKLFLVHFEFQEGDKVLGKGLRFAIAPLKAVNGSKSLYTGYPYNGSSVMDEGLLKQLRELSVKKKP